ncbi:TetR/AcrR family transcriptional regulator [Mesorhizobium sp. 1B3]|uniref:TetR/AcrR family transcriptional regulator n=1 Tax=Mesorhizobium sp. 1B3 TaxID=3243599 RepID=UPI003D99C540
MGNDRRTGGGRDRLLETARRLFMRHGASNVGINEVTDAAGVARMTLYNNFPSKEALTVAVYEEMAAATLRALETLPEAGTEQARIEGIFDLFARGTLRADYRGCPFIHASLQEGEPSGPVHAVVQRYKRALRDQVFRALDEERAERSHMADSIVLLLDGAVTEAYIKGVAEPIAVAKRAAEILLQAVR